MTLTVDLSPDLQSRLQNAAREHGLDAGEVTRRLLDTYLPPAAATVPADRGSDDRASLVALLESWVAQDAAKTPDEASRAERDLAGWKQAMNENRAANGERLLFP